MKHTPFLTILLLAVCGCATLQKEGRPWNQPSAWTPESDSEVTNTGPWPEHATDLLTPDQCKAYEKLIISPVAVPQDEQYSNDPVLFAIYSNWYRKGYAFAEASKTTLHHHSLTRDGSAERNALVLGWLYGQNRSVIEGIRRCCEELEERANKTNGE